MTRLPTIALVAAILAATAAANLLTGLQLAAAPPAIRLWGDA